jgi:hypothetical protein
MFVAFLFTSKNHFSVPVLIDSFDINKGSEFGVFVFMFVFVCVCGCVFVVVMLFGPFMLSAIVFVSLFGVIPFMFVVVVVVAVCVELAISVSTDSFDKFLLCGGVPISEGDKRAKHRINK